ncbi:hypothetical protein PV679_24590 [Streptomyces sp. AK02-01A]|nr:hypothetical protein [Streptomyces sp. AK02-01A]
MATTERGHDTTAGSEAPEVGQLVRDTTRNKVGVVMGEWAGRYSLRPVGGGLEWEAVNVLPVPAREELSIRLAAKNSGDRWGK